MSEQQQPEEIKQDHLQPQDPEAEPPVVFGGLLPGDALEALDEQQQPPLKQEEKNKEEEDKMEVELTASASVPPTASTSTTTPQPSQQTIIPLLSTSSDGLRSRTFHAKYFSPVLHDAPLRAALELPESYFQPTASELQTAFAGQQRRRENLNDAPLLTSKLREKEAAAKAKVRADKWPQTRIRIRFSDRSQLEGVFPSTDRLIAIYEFVKLSLRPDLQSEPFVLYQTPPKREYIKGDPIHKGKNLMDLQFTPNSVFYLKFTSNESLNDLKPPPLLPSLLAAISDLPIPTPFDPTASANNAPAKAGGEPKSKSQKLGFGGSAGSVKPSWLKIGKSGKK